MARGVEALALRPLELRHLDAGDEAAVLRLRLDMPLASAPGSGDGVAMRPPRLSEKPRVRDRLYVDEGELSVPLALVLGGRREGEPAPPLLLLALPRRCRLRSEGLMLIVVTPPVELSSLARLPAVAGGVCGSAAERSAFSAAELVVPELLELSPALTADARAW